ncbi:phosphoglycerate dehydrogenase [Robinsoniella peoriensis]|uniref:phosphoglycerate dehydrogenase n=1 Tax=Robinsoniella peoriensis TaxID=180332 RepID=UPI0006940398|nr:phosphoglycerate dehydrogenase [Robinsoniella peoriensis]
MKKVKKVLVTATNYSRYCAPGKKLLMDYGCEVIENPYQRPLQFEELKDLTGDADGVIAGVESWNEELYKLSPNLKGIARFGVGVDNIDLKGARDHGITVTNCPGMNAPAVAEQAVSLMLCLTRQIPCLYNAVREGRWDRTMSHELRSRTVGLLGFGAIARNVAKRLMGFEPRVIAYDKYPDYRQAEQYGVELVSMEEVLRNSDIISMHLPANEETRHIINEKTISEMKDGVLLVNTARGSLVDEAALAEALQSGKAGGMGTDVFEQEPADLTNPLFSFPQYIATPHTSAETFENCEETSLVTAKALIDIFEGRVPENKLN